MADMLESHSPSFRSILASAALLAALSGSLALGTNAFAQAGPPPGASNPMCTRLEAQLAALDRGGGDPARDDQIRRYQDSANRQQAELDRTVAQAKRMGCESSGFFSLFSGRSAQCSPVNTRIQQMRAALDQAMSDLERARTGGRGGFGSERDNQRHSVLLALAQNNCGPQYANAVQSQRSGNFLSNLFGGDNNSPAEMPPADLDPQSGSGTYRTVCVRACDGAFFPISFATVQSRFADDERTCKAQCPAQEASLYTYRNPGEDMNSAVSLTGRTYTSLPTAFKFRTEYNASCSCKAPGQTWAEALKSIDDRAVAAQQGDIIVTEESAKKMQQRHLTKANAKKGAPPTTADSPAEVTSQPAAPTTAGTGSNTIRTVGPTFIPPKQ